ncbi:hypothetical protein ZTR_06086 [Talaromyces verruculosus]|nr:hypothetical protein ZTR_06086 [Talaromyces verruculosus]
MNRLQSVSWPSQPGSVGRVIVTLNPVQQRQRDEIQCRRSYYLPIISSAALQAAQHLDLLNKADNVSYAFHEDGFMAGLAVANKIRTDKYENPTQFQLGNIGIDR